MVKVCLPTVVLGVFIHLIFSGTTLGAFISMALIVFVSLIIIVIVGMTTNERLMLKNVIIKKIKR